MRKIICVLALVASGVVLSGCVPFLVGAGTAVVADKAVEREQGGDGLF